MSTQRSQIIIRPSRRRQESKSQREQRKQRALILAAVVAVLFIVAIPAYGYWANFIAPPRSVVLQVDDNKHTLGFMAKYLIGVQALTGQPVDLTKEPIALLQMLQQGELVRSGAERKNISVSAEELDLEIRDRIIGSSEDLSEIPQDQADREFNEAYIQYLGTTNLSEEEHRRLIENNLLKKKLMENISKDIPEVTKHAKMAWIVISSKRDQGEDATIVAQKSVNAVQRGIELGEDFAKLAETYSEDRETAVKGGEYGWVAEGAFGILDQNIFSLSSGEISGPVDTGDITYFFKVSEIDDEKVTEPEMLNRLKEVALLEWMREEQGNHRITSCFGGGSAGGPCDWQYDWLAKQVREAIPEEMDPGQNN